MRNAEVGGSLELGRSRLQWALIMPLLHSSLGDRLRPCPPPQKKRPQNCRITFRAVFYGKKVIVFQNPILKLFYGTCWNWDLGVLILIRNWDDFLKFFSSVSHLFTIFKNFIWPLTLGTIFIINDKKNLRGFSTHSIMEFSLKTNA